MTRLRFASGIVLALGVSIGQMGSVTAQRAPAADPQGQQAAPPQEPDAPDQPTFRAGVNFVRVDVIVTDRDGNPVDDLTAADFEVLENDTPQTIEQFKLVRVDGRLDPGAPPPREIRTSYDHERETAREDTRLFVIFLDDYHTRDINALVVKDPLTRFLQLQLGPADLVAIMYPLTPIEDVRFTRDHDALAAAIQRFEGRKYRYEPRNRFEEEYAHYPTEQVEQIRNQVVVGALQGLSVRLGSLREGRKAVIFVSEGFTTMLPQEMRNRNAQAPIAVTTRPDGPFEDTLNFFQQTEVFDRLKDVYNEANRNNTAIYALDPRGLAVSEFHIDETATSNQDRDALRASQDTLRVLADQTDGRAIVGRNDLARGLQQVVRDSSAYYLVGYSSSLPSDGKFHEIKLRVKRSGLQVRARKGYVAASPDDVRRASAPPAPVTPKPVQLALSALAQPGASSRYVRSWLGTARGAPGRTRVTYVWEPLADPSDARRDRAGRVSVTAVSPAGDVVFRGRVPDRVAAGTGGGGRPAPATATQQLSFDAPPGPLQLRITVEGAAGGTLDSEVREMTVPDHASASVSLSTPRVYRARTVPEMRKLVADADAMPSVDREFFRTERVLIRFDVYGAAEPVGALLNRNGEKMADLPVTAAVAGATHQVDLGLASIPPGEYVLAITATAPEGEEATALVALKVRG